MSLNPSSIETSFIILNGFACISSILFCLKAFQHIFLKSFLHRIMFRSLIFILMLYNTIEASSISMIKTKEISFSLGRKKSYWVHFF